MPRKNKAVRSPIQARDLKKEKGPTKLEKKEVIKNVTDILDEKVRGVIMVVSDTPKGLLSQTRIYRMRLDIVLEGFMQSLKIGAPELISTLMQMEVEKLVSKSKNK